MRWDGIEILIDCSVQQISPPMHWVRDAAIQLDPGAEGVVYIGLERLNASRPPNGAIWVLRGGESRSFSPTSWFSNNGDQLGLHLYRLYGTHSGDVVRVLFLT
jgi:hypothetical protein